MMKSVSFLLILELEPSFFVQPIPVFQSPLIPSSMFSFILPVSLLFPPLPLALLVLHASAASPSCLSVLA